MYTYIYHILPFRTLSKSLYSERIDMYTQHLVSTLILLPYTKKAVQIKGFTYRSIHLLSNLSNYLSLYLRLCSTMK